MGNDKEDENIQLFHLRKKLQSHIRTKQSSWPRHLQRYTAEEGRQRRERMNQHSGVLDRREEMGDVFDEPFTDESN